MKTFGNFLLIAVFLAFLVPGVSPLFASEPVAAAEGQAQEEHGESWVDTVAKWFNFAVLVGLLYFFLVKKMKVTDTFRSEAEEIQRSIESARQAKEEAEKKLKELDEKMMTLTHEIEKIKDQAVKDAEAERLRILEAAQAEAKRIVDLANREVESEVRLAKKQILKIVGNIAVQKGKKIVQDEITEVDQNRLIDDYIGSFGKK